MVRDSILAVSGAPTAGGGRPFEDFIVEKLEHSPHHQQHLYDLDHLSNHRRSTTRFTAA